MQARGARSGMDRFIAVGDVIRAPLGAVAGWLGGCSHRRTSFPITLRGSVSLDGPQRTAETYIVCMACGRHFAYDWNRMRIARCPAAGAAGGRVQIGNRTRADIPAVNEASAPEAKVGHWNRSAKSAWRALATLLALAIVLTWVSAADIQHPWEWSENSPTGSATH